MDPDDRVLVGVIRRRRDLALLRDAHWYRIPQEQARRGLDADYLAFFLSGGVFREQSGGIHYFARRSGLELAYRRDLLPDEPDHPRAGCIYYKVQVEPLLARIPPHLNPNRRRISFIHTTWDRFVAARTIDDLYSRADYFVDRVYQARRGGRPDSAGRFIITLTTGPPEPLE